jgi:hypothetical protein
VGRRAGRSPVVPSMSSRRMSAWPLWQVLVAGWPPVALLAIELLADHPTPAPTSPASPAHRPTRGMCVRRRPREALVLRRPPPQCQPPARCRCLGGGRHTMPTPPAWRVLARAAGCHRYRSAAYRRVVWRCLGVADRGTSVPTSCTPWTRSAGGEFPGRVLPSAESAGSALGTVRTGAGWAARPRSPVEARAVSMVRMRLWSLRSSARFRRAAFLAVCQRLPGPRCWALGGCGGSSRGRRSSGRGRRDGMCCWFCVGM